MTSTSPSSPAPPGPNETATPTWERLVSAALVGTARRGVPDAPDLPPTPDSDDPAAALLHRAALATVQRRAGWVPTSTAHPSPRRHPMTGASRGRNDAPAPDDDTPVVGDAAANRLRAILAGERATLLSEWLDLAARHGRCVPHDVLPELLRRGAQDNGLRPKIAAVAGPRGRWLAALNPEWAYLGAHGGVRFDPQVWEHGTAAERRGTFAALRAEDPDRARELLTEAWTSEPAERRRGLLHVLATGLSLADEPLLERALNDRGASVRGAALVLLAKLLDSAHADRLRGYARRHVRRADRDAASPAGDSGPALAVSLPDLDDTDLARDLALARPKKGGASTELRQEWLWTLVSYTPLGLWSEHLGVAPKEIALLAVTAEEWELFAGLCSAVTVQEDAEWARTLLPFSLGLEERRVVRLNRAPGATTLLGQMSAADRCAWAVRKLDDPSDDGLRTVLNSMTGDWDEELSERVADRVLRMVERGRGTYLLSNACDDAALRMPPHLCERFAPVTPDTHPSVVRLETTLRFRHEMLKEFR